MAWHRWLASLAAHMRALRSSTRADQDLDDELSFHLAMEAEANRCRGRSDDDATRRARLRLGGVEQSKELARDVRPLRWLRDLAQDLRYAARVLRRTPGFTAVAVMMLALGVGATTALFSAISAVLLTPLPYPHPERLVRLWTHHVNDVSRSGTSWPDYFALQAHGRSFDAIGAYYFAGYTLTGTDRPELLSSAQVTPGLWTAAGVAPLYGRVFSESEQSWGAHHVVVLSAQLWQRRFGADAAVVGRTIELDGGPYTVIGVMPASFALPNSRIDLWTPLAFPPGDPMYTRLNRSFQLVGRLTSGASHETARADLARILAALERDVPENAGVTGVAIEPLHDTVVGTAGTTLWLLFGAATMVLLIACVNIANLLVARASAREAELAVRVALGAGQARLVRQLFTENVLLAISGAAASLLAAAVLIRLIPMLSATGIPRLGEVTMDAAVLAFAIACALTTGLLFGLWPARHAARTAAIAARVREAPTHVAGNRRSARGRYALVAIEVALSFVLLVGAALLIVSAWRVQRVDPGFDPHDLFTARITLPAARYGDADRTGAFIQQVVEQIAALPGVRAAGATTSLPLSGNDWNKYFHGEGLPVPASLSGVPTVSYRQITPDYLRTMRASLRKGRLLTIRDGQPGQPLVAVVNHALARRYWPDDDPVGKWIAVNPPESLIPERLIQDYIAARTAADPAFRFTGLPRLTIIGVVDDFRQDGLDRDGRPEVFVPLAQHFDEYASDVFLVARTTGDPLMATGAISRVVNSLDPNMPLANVLSMESRLAASLAQRRIVTVVLAGFAALALILAIVGLYGVVAYTTNQRRREFGVRAALGATGGDLVRLVIGDGVRMIAAGIAMGLVAAAALTRLLTSHLVAIEAFDPAVYAAVSVILVVVAVTACGVPVMRASRVDSATVLRCE